MKIISYVKYIDAITTKELLLPTGAGHALVCTELATVDGTTYVHLPDGAVLPTAQPEEIANSIQALDVPLPEALRDAIRAASPHVRLINERVNEKIRAAYSIEDEMKFARIGVGAAMSMHTPTAKELADMAAFGAHVEAARAWGREQKAALGL
jgi:hypothetical protein